MEENIIKEKKHLIIYPLLILGMLLSSIYYIININFYSTFKIEIYQNDINISNQFEVIGTSFFNRESKLYFDNECWKNSKNWYFKEIHIIPIKVAKSNSSFTIKKIDKNNNTQLSHYPSSVQKINLPVFENNNFLDQFIFFIKITLKSTNRIISPFILFLFLCCFSYFAITHKNKPPSIKCFSENHFLIFSIIVFTLFFSIIIFLSQYLFPCGEDMIITRDIFSNEKPIYYYYTQLDARYFTNFLYQFLNPLYYNLPFWVFKLIPSFLVLTLTLSIYYLISTCCNNKKISISYSLLLVTIFFSFVPNTKTALFFMGASYHYTVFIILLINILSVAIKYIQNKSFFNAILLSFLIFIFHGSNEYSLLTSLLLMIVIIASEIKTCKKIKSSTLLIIIVYILSSILVIKAQGNYNRIHSESSSWFSELPFYAKAYQISSRLFIDNLIFLKNIILKKPFIIILAFFWMGISINSKLKFPKQIINTKNIKTTYLLLSFFILFVFPLPLYASGVWSKNPNGIYSQYYHNIQFFLLIVTNFIFLKQISEKFKKNYLVLQIQAFVLQKKMLYFLIATLLFSKSLLSNTVIDIINDSLHQYYNEIKNTEIYLTKNNNLSVINVYEPNHQPLTVGGHNYYIGNSIIGEPYLKNYHFKTINGISNKGDTTYRNEHLKNDIKYYIKNKIIFFKRPLSFFNFEKKNQIKIIKNITLYNPEQHILKSIFIGINFAFFDTSYAEIKYTLTNKKRNPIATFKKPIEVCTPVFFKSYIYKPNNKNSIDRYIIYLCYKGKLKQNYKVYMKNKN